MKKTIKLCFMKSLADVSCSWEMRKKLRLVLALACFSVTAVQAQSFDQQLKKIETLQERSVYDSALTLTNTLLASDRLDADQVISLLLSKQLSFYYLGKYDSMRIGSKTLARKITPSSKLYANWLFTKGLLSGEEGGYEEAIRSLKEAELIFEKQKQLANLAKVYNSLGTNFRELQEFNQAKTYYKKGRTLHKSLGDSLGVVMADNNLGSVYRSEDRLDSALFYYEEAALLLSAQKNIFLLAQNQLNIGNTYIEREQFDRAEPYFMRCLALSEEAGIDYGVLMSRLNIGNLYRLKKEFVKGKEWLNLALEQANTMGLPRERGYVLEGLSLLALDSKDFEGAYRFGMESQKIKDSLASEPVKLKSLALEEQYEAEKKANEILQLEAEKQRVILIISLCGICLLVLVVFWLYGRYRQNRLLNQKLLLEAQQKELHSAIQVKDMELTAQTLQLLQFKKLLNKQSGQLAAEKKEATEDQGLLGLQQETYDLLQQELETRITEANDDFLNLLLLTYPDLKPNELLLCAYLRLNLSIKDLSEVLNKSGRSIENSRSSIRQKMGLAPKDSLVAHLIAMSNTER